MGNVHRPQKPLIYKTHNHSHDDEHEHHHEHQCNCTHDHSHEELYGELEEVPAIFSYSTSLEFSREIKGYDIQTSLVDLIENLKSWVSQNKYFIGHIKIFAESEKIFNLWISTTGKNINIKGSNNKNDVNVKKITINITAIIFGADEQTLRLVTLENLKRTFIDYNS